MMDDFESNLRRLEAERRGIVANRRLFCLASLVLTSIGAYAFEKKDYLEAGCACALYAMVLRGTRDTQRARKSNKENVRRVINDYCEEREINLRLRDN